jgi:hypothetical protein
VGRACGADLSGVAVTGAHKRQVLEVQPAPPPVVTEYRVAVDELPCYMLPCFLDS